MIFVISSQQFINTEKNVNKNKLNSKTEKSAEKSENRYEIIKIIEFSKYHRNEINVVENHWKSIFCLQNV